jgi:histidinol-phosphate aminotransferase
MTDPRLTPLAASLPATVPFTGPEALERRMGRPIRARLGANESAFGPSPLALAAMERAARDAWMYGDPEAWELRGAVAERHRCDPAHVMVGEGIDGLLALLVRLTVEAGRPVVASKGAYPTFGFHVAGFGGRLLTVPYRGDGADPKALGGLAREAGARLVYLANPDNPMGSLLPAQEVEALAATLPEGALLVLDEAYVEFPPEGSLPRIDPANPRVVRLRTFSKAHGLAGLRVGYAVGPADLVAAFDRVRNHFGLGRVAQAGALAAIGDAAWPKEVAARTARARDRIGEIARASGLAPLPSHANFVAIDCGGDGALARAVLDGLLARGVFVRMPGVAPLDRCIRVSAGPDGALDAFAAALPAALAEARSQTRP